MFEQVKLEPLQFYHSNCQPQFPTAPQSNSSLLLQHPSQHSSTLIESENKNNVNWLFSFIFFLMFQLLITSFFFWLQPNENLLVSQIKPELLNDYQVNTNTSTSVRKSQTCRICGKVLSSASSYYVHMKLHSGVKNFQCKIPH